MRTKIDILVASLGALTGLSNEAASTHRWVGRGGACLAARASAQQARPVIGFLSSRSQKESALHLTAFRHGLSALGFIEGQNVSVEYRWADGRYEELKPLAAELVARQITLLVATGGNVSGVAAKGVTDTTPIVFIVGEDPVKLGLVASLNSPGGNATGVSVFTTELAGKRLQLLNDLAPPASSVGLLVNPKYPGSGREVAAVRNAATVVGRPIAVVEASTDSEIEAAFTNLAGRQVKALVVGADALFVSHRNQIVTLTTRHAMMSIFDLRDYVEAGGLLSYGTNLADMYRQVGVYAGRLLRGVSPKELPVEQPTKFELVINLKAAKALGVTIPSSLLARADEVIE